ncbi:hypothetical protein HY440_00375 [Candidatus Microgenomates bacterium]|nr:hypothetical protein [Candidatus Microgenomates bacterium]
MKKRLLSGEQKLEIAFRLSKIAREKVLAKIKARHPGVNQKELTKLYFKEIELEKYF